MWLPRLIVSVSWSGRISRKRSRTGRSNGISPPTNFFASFFFAYINFCPNDLRVFQGGIHPIQGIQHGRHRSVPYGSPLAIYPLVRRRTQAMKREIWRRKPKISNSSCVMLIYAFCLIAAIFRACHPSYFTYDFKRKRNRRFFLISFQLFWDLKVTIYIFR